MGLVISTCCGWNPSEEGATAMGRPGLGRTPHTRLCVCGLASCEFGFLEGTSVVKNLGPVDAWGQKE